MIPWPHENMVSAQIICVLENTGSIESNHVDPGGKIYSNTYQSSI